MLLFIYLFFLHYRLLLLPHTDNNLFTIHIHTLITILKHQITLLHLITLITNTSLQYLSNTYLNIMKKLHYSQIRTVLRT